MRPPVIGLHGKARTGKDTVTQFVISRYAGYRYGLADPLKAMLAAGLGISMDDPYWAERKEEVIPALNASPRRLLQTLGTEWGRNIIHQDIWVTLARETLRARGPGMVISDVRFENEAEWVRSIGGIVIHIVRGAAPPVAGHASESGIARLAEDRVLMNNGTLDDLRAATYELLDGVMGV